MYLQLDFLQFITCFLSKQHGGITTPETRQQLQERLAVSLAVLAGYSYTVRDSQVLEASGAQDDTIVQCTHGEYRFQNACCSHGVTVVAF